MPKLKRMCKGCNKKFNPPLKKFNGLKWGKHKCESCATKNNKRAVSERFRIIKSKKQ
jgi:hypothetical protein